jgi:hypothetical protein
MSRREIVVEGTTYHWETNGHSIAIIPPKGTGPTRRYCVAREIGASDYDYDDYGGRVAITPGDIASLIYRDILEKPMPPKKTVSRPIQHRKMTPVAHWKTAADLPRTYLVQATVSFPEGGEVSIPLEVHETPVTAREAVSRMNGPVVQNLIAAALKSPNVDVLQKRRGDEFHAVNRLIDWLRAMPVRAVEGAQVVISTTDLPFKIAA